MSNVDKTDEPDNGVYLLLYIYHSKWQNWPFILRVDISDEISSVHENPASSETIKRKISIPKTDSNYAVVNGSVVNRDAEDADNTVTIASADTSFPRSETIAAIGHRPYTGDLEPVRVLKEISMSEGEENDGNGEFCRKCGHYSKHQ